MQWSVRLATRRVGNLRRDCWSNAAVALYSVLVSGEDAVAAAGLGDAELQDLRTACVVGTSAGSVDSVHRAGELYYSGQVRRIDPYLAFRCMSQTAAAAVAK